MTKKWKVFGVQTDIEWYDVRTKCKLLLRKITYSVAFQELICLIIMGYMKLVYVTSKKKFVNLDKLFGSTEISPPIIVAFWHNRLMMMPLIPHVRKKLYPNYNFMTLASRHGDGRFVGRTMERLNLISIAGSSRDKRKASRGIDIGNFKKLFSGLKKGYSMGITPDGPRGPNQKIHGEIINIARISRAGILAGSYSASRFKKLNTWDKFMIPLPFSTICFYFDETPIYVPQDAGEEEMEQLRITVEKRMNFVQEESQNLANYDRKS